MDFILHFNHTYLHAYLCLYSRFSVNIPVVNDQPDEGSNDGNDDNSSVVLITVLAYNWLLCNYY